MKQNTLIIEQIKLARAEEHAVKLCTFYKCSLIDLIVLSIKVQSEQNKNKIK